MTSQRTADVARYRLGIGQPIIAAMMHDPGAIHSVEQARNARRKATFYAQLAGAGSAETKIVEVRNETAKRTPRHHSADSFVSPVHWAEFNRYGRNQRP